MQNEHDIGIVVLTNDIDKTPKGYVPDELSYMRLAAAAIKYYSLSRQGNKPYMIISGGKIRAGPSLAEILAKTAINNFHISVQDICTEDKSINTIENAKYSVAELVKKNIWDSILITNEFQLERALDCFWIYCKKQHQKMVFGYSAEDIIVQTFPERKNEIDFFKNKKDTQRRYVHNQRHRIIINIPFIGPSLLNYGVRAQMVLLGERPQEHVLNE